MSQSHGGGEASLPRQLIPLLETACDRFEAALMAGDRPEIESYLEEMPEHGRPALFRELLFLDLAYRDRCGERLDATEYQVRFPDFATVIDGVFAEVRQARPGRTEKSLGSLAAGASTLDRLAALGDTDLTGSITREGSHTPASDATAIKSVGTTSSEGQRFRVLRPHARGGLGAVFLALDSELNREVALKQILEHRADDPAARQRFLLEAEITGGLEHPGIVPVYGVGTYDSGRPFYAMRFVKGDSLKDAITRFHSAGGLTRDAGRRSVELRRLIRSFLDACNAIGYAHDRGVLHRDIKPENVIVGKHGETLVVDWGLAKATGRPDPATDEQPLRPARPAAAPRLCPARRWAPPPT